MNDATKAFFMSLLKSVVDRAIVAGGVALITNGLLDQAQAANFDQIVSGIVMGLIGLGIGWYRDHGKALMKAKLDEMTKAAQAPHPVAAPIVPK